MPYPSPVHRYPGPVPSPCSTLTGLADLCNVEKHLSEVGLVCSVPPVYDVPTLQIVVDDKTMSIDSPFGIQMARRSCSFAMCWSDASLSGILLGPPHTGS
jgi:hypothetical protein